MSFDSFHTKTETIQFETETSFGGGTPADGTIRPRFDEITVSFNHSTNVEEQANKGYAHPYNRDDAPVTLPTHVQDALKITLKFRGPATAGNTPPLFNLLEAGSCETIDGVEDTIDTYTDLHTFVSAGLSGEIGQCVQVELDDGRFAPALIAGLSTNTYTLGCDLPGAASADNNLYAVDTIYPIIGRESNDDFDTISFRHQSRMEESGGDYYAPSGVGAWLDSVDTIALEPNMVPAIALNFSAARVTSGSDEDIDTVTFTDSEQPVRIGGLDSDGNTLFQCAIGDSSTSGGIATPTCVDLIKAEINLGIGCNPVAGSGNSGANNVSTVIAKSENKPTLTLTTLVDEAFKDDIENTTYQDKYIHFIQMSTNAAIPTFGFFAPKCYQIADPIFEKAGDYWVMKTTWQMTCADYGSDTGLTDPEKAPWFMCVGLPTT